jgi:pyruvate-ferredoxin/flavodoxin oxidoreductase
MSKMKTMDGNTAAAHSAYAFTEVAAIFPITPSSPMAEFIDEWSAYGRKNIFGQEVKVVEMQSEGGAAGAVHGSLTGGALTSTFTASQGLLLMVPNMYKIAGEFLPGVFHVTARAIASHALSIFGDHSDVMAARQTGFAFLASNSVQESMDMAAIAHLAAISTSIPFVHFFDGFRTSHEVQKIDVLDYNDLAGLVDMDAVKKFKDRSLNPEHPYTKGTAQNPDIFFQCREASNTQYVDIADTVEYYMNELAKITGRKYRPFEYYGAADATEIIVAMGSVVETIEEVVDYLNETGKKVGVIKVRLYRPFSVKHLLEVLPKTVKKIAVLDRTKEPGAPGEPLYLDIKSVFFNKENAPVIVGGRYGLGSKDTTPSQIFAVYENLQAKNSKDDFTIGIVDDVTNKSLSMNQIIMTENKGTVRCKFWGLGSDGTVGANKSAIKIIGDNTDMYAQGYFEYDSKKSGGVTISHLRFGKTPIRSTYLISEADFISCSLQSYVYQFDLLNGLKKGGTFLLNTTWTLDEIDDKLPADMKKYIAENDINFYIIDATALAQDIGLGGRTNMIMQTAFFKLSQVIDFDDAVKYLKDAVIKSYGKKGDKIVKMNMDAIERSITSLKKVEVKDNWINAVGEKEAQTKDEPEFIQNILRPISAKKGDDIPVSVFKDIADGAFPAGTSAYEKRGIAAFVPTWIKENCIQCGRCSFVCPHASIRTFLLTEDEAKAAPNGFDTVKAKGKEVEGYSYRVQVSPLDCTGCGSCAQVCPAKEKALVMEPIASQMKEADNFEYALTLKDKSKGMNRSNIKTSQFVKPLLEFSGACAGCGETPYAKYITQYCGERMIIANATGCSSIWGASAPSMPYTVNEEGRGPAWANSLFEDNAEYGYGMAVAVKQIRELIKINMEYIAENSKDQQVVQAANKWLSNMNDPEMSRQAGLEFLELEAKASDCKQQFKVIKENKDYLGKKSVWIFGGDGWAYDIGYGGLDHVLASGENVNVLVFDTEVYSNTGGQASKATPTASVAKFAASGKKTKKKDLGMMAISYNYIYVAQVALGADMNQFIKAVKEAESYDGPSLIIAYAPCINHGIKAGMGKSIEQEKKAVESGYWHLYRYNPVLAEEGKNPFSLDSKEPKDDFIEFLKSETRYTTLEQQFPKEAKEMFAKAETESKQRYESYKKLSE